MRKTTRLGITIAIMAFLVSCIFDSEYGIGGPPNSAPGYLSLKLTLGPNSRVLRKKASTDTIFNLDTLKIVLTAPNAATRNYSFPISGRSDTGAITYSVTLDSVPSLKTVTAKILTIDTTLNPTRRDTVHFDSTTFSVKPADTTQISFTVNSLFAILRARFASFTPDSLTDTVQYLRLRVDGTTRDSIRVGNTLNAVDFLSGFTAVGFAAGDRGRIMKTTNSGTTWSIKTSGTTQRLNSISSVPTDSSKVMAAGDNGTILNTVNGGRTWSAQTSGTSENLKRIQFVDANISYAVGDGGSILKTQNGGTNWSIMKSGFSALSSGVSNTLSATAFADTNIGWAVGTTGTLLKTTDGTTWAAQTSGTSQDLNAIYDSSSTKAYVVGNSGTLLKTSDGTSWSAQTPGVTPDLKGVHFGPALAYGVVVGDSETISKTLNAGLTWSSRSSGWFTSPSGISTAINSIFFFDASNGWAVGAGGTILRTTNGGTSWSAQTSNTTNALNSVYFSSASIGIAVGASGTILYTSNGGTTWSTGTVSGGTLDGLNSVSFVLTSTTIAYTVGDNGKAAKSTNGGANWTFLAAATVGAGSGSLRWIAFESVSVGIIVGNAGATRRIAAANGTQTYGTGGTVGGGSLNLKSASYGFAANTYVVAGDGGIIYKTANLNNASPTWTALTSGTAQNLTRIHLTSTTTGYAVGASGTILSTVNFNNATPVWTAQTSGTTQTLNAAYCLSALTSFVAGNNGTILKTANTGANWSGKPTKMTLRGAHVFSATSAIVVGDSGVVLRSVNGDSTWVPFASGTTQQLNSAFLSSATVGWVAGNAGTIIKITTFSTTPVFTAQTSGTTQNLTKIYFADANNGFAVGSAGVVLKTTNAGTNWTAEDTVGNGQNGVYLNTDLHIGYSVGASGSIYKTTSFGEQWNASPWNATYFTSATVGYVAGDGGALLTTTDGGRIWTAQSSTTTNDLYGMRFFDANNGQVVGNAGTTCRTKNAGTLWACYTAGTKPLRSVVVTSMGNGGIVYAVGDSIWKSSTFGTTPQTWSLLTNPSAQSMRGVDFTSTTTGYAVGGLETILGTTASGAPWTIKTSGTKMFDTLLTYKYLKPGVSHTVILDAMINTSSLKGYQGVQSINVASGRDSTINLPVTKCGYGGATPTCQ